MTLMKKIAMALIACAAIAGCKKTMPTDADNNLEDTPNGPNALVASNFRVLVNGVNLSKNVTGYQNPLTNGSVVMVDARAFLERMNYRIVSTPTNRFIDAVKNVGNTGNLNPNAADQLVFFEGFTTVSVRFGTSTVNQTMPVAASYTAAPGNRMMVPLTTLIQYTGIPADLFEFDAATNSYQIYFYEECDYGLYFIGRQDASSTDAIGAQKFDPAGGANPHFDPAKPTVVYIHGWQPNAVNRVNSITGRLYSRENLFINTGGLIAHTQNAFIDGITRTIGSAPERWNVAIFNWIQLADDDYESAFPANRPDIVETKIYNPTVAGIGMRWVRTNGTLETVNTPRKSVAGLLADELNQLRAASPGRELRLIGNSLGGNLAMAVISQQLASLPQLSGASNASLTSLPERVTLMDPYWSKLSRTTSPVNTAAFCSTAAVNYYNAGRALEYFRTSFLGLDGFNQGVANQSAYVNFVPGYTDILDFGGKHTLPVRQYFHSFGMTTTARPLEILGGGLTGNARLMCAQTTNARIRELMLLPDVYWDHDISGTGGSGTANMNDDAFVRKPGNPQ
jgi:pimeloyl-ACP methyl ester carboxylesterase